MSTGPTATEAVAIAPGSRSASRGVLGRLAALVAATHFVVSMYILFGGLLVVWGLVPMWWHIPIAAWGVWVHLVNWTCPLTPLEKWLRIRAGEAAYSEGFVERYILPRRFRGRVTNAGHRLVGLGVLAVNLAIYSVIVFRNG
jgi:hypothetical protein